MRTIQLELFTFNELNDDAKQKAIEDHRGLMDIHLDCEIEYFTKGALTGTGFKIDKISYSGFYSQGDGASFTGYYDSTLIDLEKLRGFSLKAYELMAGIDSIFGASGLTSENVITANIERIKTSLYYHENTTAVTNIAINGIDEWEDVDSRTYKAFELIENYLLDLKNSLCHLIYSSLESEYEHQQSDEYIGDILTINDYYFLADGTFYE